MLFTKVLAVVLAFLTFTLASFAAIPPNASQLAPLGKIRHISSSATHDADLLQTRGFETPSFTFKHLYNLTARFMDAFLYPANIAQIDAVNSTLFSDNVIGRIDATRTFVGRELNTEYVFGLFASLQQNPHFFTMLGLPIAYNFTHFAACQNVVGTAVLMEFEIVALGITAPLELDLWLTFNKNGEISQYDGTFRWRDWQFDVLYAIGQSVMGLNSTTEVEAEITTLLATSVCETASMYCNGTNTQYTSTSACYHFLTQDIRLGSSYELGMNTLMCRMVHQVMVPFRPDVHCPHIGPTGGMYCVDDLTYAGVVTESIFTNTPFVPNGYSNKNETIAGM